MNGLDLSLGERLGKIEVNIQNRIDVIDHRLTRLEAADLAANFGDNLRFDSTAPQANQETEGNINNVFNSLNVPSREAMISGGLGPTSTQRAAEDLQGSF